MSERSLSSSPTPDQLNSDNTSSPLLINPKDKHTSYPSINDPLKSDLLQMHQKIYAVLFSSSYPVLPREHKTTENTKTPPIPILSQENTPHTQNAPPQPYSRKKIRPNQSQNPFLPYTSLKTKTQTSADSENTSSTPLSSYGSYSNLFGTNTSPTPKSLHNSIGDDPLTPLTIMTYPSPHSESSTLLYPPKLPYSPSK